MHCVSQRACACMTADGLGGVSRQHSHPFLLQRRPRPATLTVRTLASKHNRRLGFCSPLTPEAPLYPHPSSGTGGGGPSTAGRTPTEVSLRRTQGLPAPIKLVPFIHKPSRFFPSRVWPRLRAHRDNRRARRSGDASLPVSMGELTNMWTPLPNH